MCIHVFGYWASLKVVTSLPPGISWWRVRIGFSKWFYLLSISASMLLVEQSRRNPATCFSYLQRLAVGDLAKCRVTPSSSAESRSRREPSHGSTMVTTANSTPPYISMWVVGGVAKLIWLFDVGMTPWTIWKSVEWYVNMTSKSKSNSGKRKLVKQTKSNGSVINSN